MTFTEQVQQGTPYRMRLRAAFKALCWWKPWHSYYGLLDGCQWYSLDEYEKGFDEGWRMARERSPL